MSPSAARTAAKREKIALGVVAEAVAVDSAVVVAAVAAAPKRCLMRPALSVAFRHKFRFAPHRVNRFYVVIASASKSSPQ